MCVHVRVCLNYPYKNNLLIKEALRMEGARPSLMETATASPNQQKKQTTASPNQQILKLQQKNWETKECPTLIQIL